MAHSSWLYLAYGAGLFYLYLNPSRVQRPLSLRYAWNWYVAALGLVLFFTLFRAGNWNEPEVVLVEYWSQGVSWLFVTISLCFIPGALSGGGERDR